MDSNRTSGSQSNTYDHSVRFPSGLLGMRLGANFAVAQRGFEPVDAAVLWDPCPTGRSFLREQRALGLFAVVLKSGDDADPLDFPGFKLSSEMAEEISNLDLMERDLGPIAKGGLANRVLLLTRTERVADRKLAQRFEMPNVEHREVPGQPELLNVHDDWPVVPTEGLATTVEWLDKVMPRSSSGVAIPTRSEVTVEVSSSGLDVAADQGAENAHPRTRSQPWPWGAFRH